MGHMIFNRKILGGAAAATIALFSTQVVLATELKPCTAPSGVNLTARDNERLAGLIESRSKAIAAVGHEAEDAGEQSKDVVVGRNVGKLVSSLIEPGLLPLNDVVAGNYRCRWIQMGEPAVAYGYFSCQVTRNDQGSDQGWTLTKTSGSQRFSGVLKPGGDGLVYVGASFVAGEKAPKYGDNAETDQVGCLYRAADAPRHYVLELPQPGYGSQHDVVELVPAK